MLGDPFEDMSVVIQPEFFLDSRIRMVYKFINRYGKISIREFEQPYAIYNAAFLLMWR